MQSTNSNNQQTGVQRRGISTELIIAFRTMPKDLAALEMVQKEKQAAPIAEETTAQEYAPPAEAKMPSFGEAAEEIPFHEAASIEPSPPEPATLEEPVHFTQAEKQTTEPEYPAPRAEEIPLSESALPISEEPLSKTAKPNISALFAEAKSLYQRRFYQEAADKFQEIISYKPYGLLARWYKSKADRKFKKYQAGYLQKQKEEGGEIQKKFTEELRLEEQKRSAVEENLRDKEYLIEQQTERIRQAETQLRASLKQQEALQEQARQAQRNLTNIQQQEEARTSANIAEQTKISEEAKKQLENKLKTLEHEKTLLEEQLKHERSAMQSAGQPAVPTPLASSFKPPTSPPRPATAPYQAPQPIPESSPILSFLTRGNIIRALIIVLSLFLVGSGVVYLIGYFSQPETSPKPVEQTAAVLPSPLFLVDETAILSLPTGQKKFLYSQLENLSSKNYPAGSFTRVLIKTTDQNQKEKYASLIDFIDSFQISMPAEVLASLSGNYTLFVYAQKELPASPFAMGLGKNKLGLAAQLKETEKISGAIANWKQTMPDDLDALFLGRKISFSNEQEWQEILYKDILIRSLNLPNRFSSLNYAFYQDKLLISTSLESIESLIDRLTP